VSQLRLGVASNDLPRVDKGHIVTNLLLTSKLVDCLREHRHMKGHWVRPTEQVVPVVALVLLVRVVRDEMSELWISHNDSKARPPLLELLLTSLFKPARVRPELWMFFNEIMEHLEFYALFFWEQDRISLFLVERTAGSLLYK